MKLLKLLDFLLLPLLFAAILGLIHEGWEIHRISQINRAIKEPESIRIDADSPPEIRFAKAWQLGQRGEIQEALRLYSQIEHEVDSKQIEKIKFNMGTLYLKQAASYWNSQGVWAYSEVLTWAALAQNALHEVLVLNPYNWDARYNLEYALRIEPPPRESEKADWTGHKSSVHAIYPGLPGGGP